MGIAKTDMLYRVYGIVCETIYINKKRQYNEQSPFINQKRQGKKKGVVIGELVL